MKLKHNLLEAVKSRNVKLVLKLLDNESPRSSLDQSEALLSAIKSPGYITNQEIAILLIRSGFGLETNRNIDLLKFAIVQENEDLVLFLISAGVKVNQGHFGICKNRDVLDVLKYNFGRVLSLKQISRLVIRHGLIQGSDLPLSKAIGLLEIPEYLKQYLNLDWL